MGGVFQVIAKPSLGSVVIAASRRLYHGILSRIECVEAKSFGFEGIAISQGKIEFLRRCACCFSREKKVGGWQVGCGIDKKLVERKHRVDLGLLLRAALMQNTLLLSIFSVTEQETESKQDCVLFSAVK